MSTHRILKGTNTDKINYFSIVHPFLFIIGNPGIDNVEVLKSLFIGAKQYFQFLFKAICNFLYADRHLWRLLIYFVSNRKEHNVILS
jgi:hypothetical protein